MQIPYLPYDKRHPDDQYQKLLSRIIASGKRTETKTDEDALRVIGHELRFPLMNGFPIITERDLVSPGEKTGSQHEMAIGELCAFLNGAQTLDELKKFGCGWWRRWATPEKCAKRGLSPGDLGPGSYGAVWRRFPTTNGIPFDQITTLIEQINELPHLRTLRVTNWIPQYIPRGENRIQHVVVAPCHGDFHVLINTETREMTLCHIQRSADVPVGLVFNFIQYAALLLMIAQVCNYTPVELVHYVVDAHIYVNQIDTVKKLLRAHLKPFPTVTVDPSVNNIFDFRPHHFAVADYYPQNERMQIWTPV